MRTRRLMAAAVLAALPLFTGTLDAQPPRPTTDTAPSHHVAERTSGPRWLHSIGFDFGWGWANACVYAGGSPIAAYALAA